MEAEAEDGVKFSTLLQNAETVRLISAGGAAGAGTAAAAGGTAVSVSVLKPGDRVLVHRQEVRGVHSYTSHLNLSRLCHGNQPTHTQRIPQKVLTSIR